MGARRVVCTDRADHLGHLARNAALNGTPSALEVATRSPIRALAPISHPPPLPPCLPCSPSLAPHNKLQQLRLTKKIISAARHDGQVRELDWEDAEYGGLRGEVRTPPPTIPASGARARGAYRAGRRYSIGC
jgi:hypothetical protein